MNLFQNFKMPRLRLPSLYADKKTPRKPPNYLLWAFLLPFLGMLAVMLLGVCGFANMWLAVFADVGVAMLCIFNALRAMK